ncbi:MAG: hypothetical protein QXS69_02375 [Candidatus Aenigmatarchaeota archaeon]
MDTPLLFLNNSKEIIIRIAIQVMEEAAASLRFKTGYSLSLYNQPIYVPVGGYAPVPWYVKRPTSGTIGMKYTAEPKSIQS